MPKLDFSRLVAEAVLLQDDFFPQQVTGVIDSATFAETGFSGGGRADVMNKLGCRWRPSEKGISSRLAGKSAIQARLALRDNGYPGLIIFRTCRNLIRTLPALTTTPTTSKTWIPRPKTTL